MYYVKTKYFHVSLNKIPRLKQNLSDWPHTGQVWHSETFLQIHAKKIYLLCKFFTSEYVGQILENFNAALFWKKIAVRRLIL